MNSDRIGAFIKKLREDNNISQQKLADEIPIGREAVSKWECGRTIPDAANLVKLSQIFDVSIDEIMYGEYKTKENKKAIENINMEIYDDRNATNLKLEKTSKKLLITIILLIIGILSFLIYYFLYTYDSVKIYTIESSQDDVFLSDSLLVITPENIYFKLGIINGIDEDEISKIVLYYDNTDKKRIIIENNSLKDELIIDYVGYGEYFEIKNKDVVFDNLYLDIYYADDIKTLKLTKKEDYSNKKLFFSKKKNIGNVEKTTNDSTNNELIVKIKEQFSSSGDEEILIQNIVINNKSYELLFIVETSELLIEWSDNDLNNSIQYDAILGSFNYKKSDSNLIDIETCSYDKNNQSKSNCNNSIIELFNTIISNIESGRS